MIWRLQRDRKSVILVCLPCSPQQPAQRDVGTLMNSNLTPSPWNVCLAYKLKGQVGFIETSGWFLIGPQARKWVHRCNSVYNGKSDGQVDLDWEIYHFSDTAITHQTGTYASRIKALESLKSHHFQMAFPYCSLIVRFQNPLADRDVPLGQIRTLDITNQMDLMPRNERIPSPSTWQPP